ncbi:hypothetical protein BGZ72_004915 [Mortierella alpina]|nr:hypothetical protein BGZ72_004915 [Mortierella alpina]
MKGGFNSGILAAGKPYRRAFPSPAVIYYKDGHSANCKGKAAMGAIFVGQKPSATPVSTTSTTKTSTTTRSDNAVTRTAAPIVATSPPRSSAIRDFSVGIPLLLGASCLLGLIVSM